MKKCTVVAGALLLVAASLFAGGKKEADTQVLKVAGLKGAYGDVYWQEIEKGFEAANPGVDVQLTIEAQVENGVLKIRIPKLQIPAPENEKKMIEVK